MHPLLPFPIPLFLLITKTLALGINCQGSALCPRASFNNHNQASIIQVLRDVVWASPKPNSTTYNSGDHVVCLSQNEPSTISPSFSGPPVAGVSAGGSIGLSGGIDAGGICPFPQGHALTLGQIRPLVDAVLDHKCTTCGSVPIHFVDKGSNDPAPGILTFNYVAAPACDRNCISDLGSPDSGAAQQQRSSAALQSQRPTRAGPSASASSSSKQQALSPSNHAPSPSNQAASPSNQAPSPSNQQAPFPSNQAPPSLTSNPASPLPLKPPHPLPPPQPITVTQTFAPAAPSTPTSNPPAASTASEVHSVSENSPDTASAAGISPATDTATIAPVTVTESVGVVPSSSSAGSTSVGAGGGVKSGAGRRWAGAMVIGMGTGVLIWLGLMCLI